MSKQITLSIDSSGPQFTAGIFDGKKIYSMQRSGIKQEQFFLPVIERVLAKAGAKLEDVAHICLVRGPGRFTGLRISITFASMMQMLNGTKVSGATLFDLLEQQVHVSPAFISWKAKYPLGISAVVLHAFREEYFLQFFDGTGAGPQWLSKEELLIQLAAREEPIFIAGTDKEGACLSALLGNKYRLAPRVDSRLRVQTLLNLAKNPIYNKNALEPLYLKPARFELGK